MIYLFNTLGNKKEEFKPLKEGEVKMYNCGPTVYNFVHIGNLRAYVFSDLLRRMFEYNDFKVHQVMNITDIGHLRSDGDEGEDKMTAALKRESKPINLESLKEVADKYTNAFLSDLISLNIEAPEIMPRASEHIQEDIDLIKKLEEKYATYKTTEGIYFDTSKFKEYGKLGQVNLDLSKDTENQSRIGVNPEKKHPQDFCVWKFSQTTPDHQNQIGFPSPWGIGFPGWHIECSSMSMKYLGDTFDIHTGGIDHVPIHHNNEIAQSEMATGKPLANYWLHNAFINISNEKISKSLGNDIYLKDLVDKGFSPSAYRFLLLGAHYKTPMNFTFDTLRGAEAGLKKLITSLSSGDSRSSTPGKGIIIQNAKKEFLSYINDDLNTARALAYVFEIIQDEKISMEDKRATIFDFDKVLGLNLEDATKMMYFKIPEEVSQLLTLRELARADKDFRKSDDLRKQIQDAGFDISDTETGPHLTKK